MKKILLPFTLILLVFATSYSQPPAYRWGYVTVAKLFYRDRPSLKGKQLGSLALAEKVLILEEGKERVEIGGKTGVWLRIESGNKKGWVFGAFISDQPVADPMEQAKKMTGRYYYVQINNPRVISRILEIKDSSYVEKYFSPDLGLTDKYTGKVVYQADSFYLDAQTRLVRPEAYITSPETDEERSAYSYAYRSFSEDEGHLVKLSKQSPQAGSQKWLILECDKKIYLTEKSGITCSTLGWVYEKK